MNNRTPRSDAMSRRISIFEVIAGYINCPDGFCWASNATISKHTGIPTRAIQKHLLWLVDEKWLAPQSLVCPRGTERRLYLGAATGEPPPKSVGIDTYADIDLQLRNGATSLPQDIPASLPMRAIPSRHGTIYAALPPKVLRHLTVGTGRRHVVHIARHGSSVKSICGVQGSAHGVVAADTLCKRCTGRVDGIALTEAGWYARVPASSR